MYQKPYEILTRLHFFQAHSQSLPEENSDIVERARFFRRKIIPIKFDQDSQS